MMNALRCASAVALLWLAALVPAFPQSTPNLIDKQVPTAAEWNSYFAAKQDALGFTPLNTAGGTMSGRLVTSPPGATLAGFNLTPGTTPGSPVNGDMWATASGLFVKINGSTFNLSGAAGLTVASSVITGGANTKVLFDNSGLLGEYTISGTGNVAMTGSPSLTTPTIAGGALSGTFTGAPTLSGALIFSGIPNFTGLGSGLTCANGLAITSAGILFEVACPGAASAITVGTTGVSSATSNTLLGPGTVSGGAGTLASVAASSGIIITSSTIAIDKANSANYFAGSSNKVLTADNVFTSDVPISFSTTQVFDFSTFIDASVTLTANITGLTCSNMKAGQSGVIRIIQDATGSRTMVSTWCTAFVWTGGAKGTLSTTPSATDWLFYQCVITTICFVSLNKAVI